MDALDNPTVIRGTVEHGDARGRELGFPTANLPLEHVPGAADLDGVWAGYVLLPGGQRVLSTISVGTRETFYGADGVRLLEAHLLDFAGDLYGQPIAVELSVYLRPQLEFNGVDALVDGLRQDELAARQWADSYNGSLGVDRGALA